MRKIDFVFFDAGGGHRSAATALKTVCEEQGRDWEIRLVNLQDVLEPLDVFKKITRIRLEDLYNGMLANGWTLGSRHLLTTIHGVIRLYHSAQVRMLTRFWADRKPDLVVSLVPNFNRSMFQGLQRAVPQAPYVTVLTDFADYPP
ncbi:MAG TPA: galactosyldiacylglycerol synthase, partial [Bryobacteraceae bacterium]|nr:galactosyldiacylglycerol synthase [Bryobacteraceae bacterium]